MKKWGLASGLIALVLVAAAVLGYHLVSDDNGTDPERGAGVLARQVSSPAPSMASSPSPSLSPPSSPSPQRKANCAAAPGQCGYPDANTTGVPAGVQLSVLTGNQTLSKAGMVVEGKDIRGCVRVTAANVVIRKSKVSCKDFYVILADAPGMVVEDVEITCGHSNGTGIGDQGFTARRVHIYGCENGFDIDENATVEHSYIHDPYEGATGHADGIQLAGGAHITIRDNTIFVPGGTSAIISHPSANSDVLVDSNFLSGGAYTLYCPRETSKGYRVLGNRFGKAAYGPLDACGKIAEFRGNYWDSNLKALNA